MNATYGERDQRRARRWLDRNSGLAAVPPEAFGLLVDRLAARRRVELRCAPLAVAVLVIIGWPFVETLRTAESASWDRTYTSWLLAGYALFAVAIIVRDRLTSRAEHRIGQTLQQRVSRGTAVSVPTMLGRARMTCLVVTLVLEGALAATLLTVGHGWLAWVYPLAFVVSCGFVVIGVRHAVTRATIAVDPVSLAIDERLRSQDAFSATLPLFFLVMVFLGSPTSGLHWLDLAWKFSAVIICALRLWGEVSEPWTSSTTPPGSLFARALSWVRP